MQIRPSRNARGIAKSDRKSGISKKYQNIAEKCMVFRNRVLAQEVFKISECALSPRRRCEKSLLLPSVALQFFFVSRPLVRECRWLLMWPHFSFIATSRFARPPLWECKFWRRVRSCQGTGTFFFIKIADARLVQGIPIYFRRRDDFLIKKMHSCKI